MAREAGFSSWPQLVRQFDRTQSREMDNGEALIESALSRNATRIRTLVEHDALAIQCSIVDAALVLLDADPSQASPQRQTELDTPPDRHILAGTVGVKRKQPGRACASSNAWWN